MTFREITSAVSIANRALGMISESKRISSLNEAGANAAAVKRWYKPIVARLLEMHHWGLATKHAALVANASNVRTGTWLYSFAPPDDMAFPVGLGLQSGLSTVSYYTGLAGLIATSQGREVFQFFNGALYSNIDGDLEYVSYDITEADFNSTFENIVILMLASRLALEIPKDRDMSEDLAKQAITEINIAMAQNMNAGHRKYGQQVSEIELARGAFGGSWDYIPIGLPSA